MKKGITIVVIGMVLLSILQGNSENLIIPKDAIRFRVIANSNDKQDQDLKIAVRDQVQAKLFQLMTTATSKDNASDLIQSTLPEFDQLVKQVTSEQGQSYKINYGMNYFPEKIYKGVEYQEGNYESLVVTLGQGQGDNWWCVLFPPLCLLEAEETEETTEVEYKFFIQEMIDQFFHSN